MITASVRYLVFDVDAAITFYCERLGFREIMHPVPGYAMLTLGDLRLVLTSPGSGPGGGQQLPDGSMPTPGGWNRIQLEVKNLEATVAELHSAAVAFRTDIITGVGSKQVIVEDPSGNPIELFEALIPEATYSPGATSSSS